LHKHLSECRAPWQKMAMHRRTLLARLPLLAAPLAAPLIPHAFAADFGGFLAGLRSRAIARGIPPPSPMPRSPA